MATRKTRRTRIKNKPPQYRRGFSLLRSHECHQLRCVKRQELIQSWFKNFERWRNWVSKALCFVTECTQRFFSLYNLIFKGFYFYFFKNTVNKVGVTPSVSSRQFPIFCHSDGISIRLFCHSPKTQPSSFTPQGCMTFQ